MPSEAKAIYHLYTANENENADDGKSKVQFYEVEITRKDYRWLLFFLIIPGVTIVASRLLRHMTMFHAIHRIAPNNSISCDMPDNPIN